MLQLRQQTSDEILHGVSDIRQGQNASVRRDALARLACLAPCLRDQSSELRVVPQSKREERAVGHTSDVVWITVGVGNGDKPS